MSITLDGTNGITTPDVDTDGLTVDTNTLFVDAANNRVGIGVTNPDAPLQVGTRTAPTTIELDGNLVFSGASAPETESIFSFGQGNSGTNANTGVTFTFIPNRGSAGSATGWFQKVDGTTAAGFMSFGQIIRGTPTTTQERMRIDASGNLLVGATTNTGERFQLLGAVSAATMKVQVGANGNNGISFINATGGTAGSIVVNASTVAYNTSSDYRLKEDVQPMVGSVDRLMALKPVNFAWKVDGSRVDGFLAHEAQEVVPECVTGEKDAVDDEGNPQYQGIDQSKIVPLLVAALQEALTKIEALEARVAALETNA
jgi:hypothetical protein